MTFRRTLALGVTSLALLATGTVGVTLTPDHPVRIGQLLRVQAGRGDHAQTLEANGWTVDRQLGLGSRAERTPIFLGGQVDLVPEYVGSGLGFYLADGASDETRRSWSPATARPTRPKR